MIPIIIKQYRLTLIAISYVWVCFAGIAGVARAETATVNQIMTEVGREMGQLFPLITARMEYGEQERQRLGQGLDRLNTLFRQAAPHFQHQAVTYQISYDYLQVYLQEARQAFAEGDVVYVRNRIYGLGYVCTSCHTQDNRGRTLFGGVERSAFADEFSFAEFNFITRNYDTAAQAYHRFLTATEDKTEWQIIQPLQRLITIFLQVRDQPEQAYKTLEQYTGLPDHSPQTARQLELWLVGLKKLIADKLPQRERMDLSMLKKLVEKYLGNSDLVEAELFTTPQQEIQRVWLRGSLYHYLNSRAPRNEVPEILYWLAVADRSINYNYYFSLADLYLKDCILSYSENPYARRCFNEYKEYVHHIYSGSAGDMVPEAVQRELTELRKALSK